MKSLLCTLALLAVGATAPAQADDSAALQALHGTFVSPAVEAWYGGYGTREFVFAYILEPDLHPRFDPAMTQRTFQFRTGGAYRVGAPSDTVDGAHRAVFDEDWKHLTLLAAAPEIAAAWAWPTAG